MSSIVSALTGGVAGIAIGEAGSSALDPVFELPRQDAWEKNTNKILAEDQLAQLVAEALNTVEDVIEDVNRNGFNSDEFETLVQLALRAAPPPVAEKLYLRAQGKYPGAITLAQLHHSYGKSGIEGQWWDPLTAAAQTTLLTPAELALGAVRGTVNDQGLLVVELDTSGSNVKQYTPAALNIIDEAAAAGINTERLRAMIGSIGLPMAVELAARATYRNILTKGAYYQAVLEGDTRPEWADSIFEVAKAIPTADQYIENYLRGWTPDFQTALNNAALHGMSAADATIIYQNMGRPLAVHQITTGLERGGVFGGYYEGVPDPYLSALRESNIRPEYGNIAYANRYTYPGYFVLKPMVASGAITVDQAATYLLYEGWEPELAALTAESFAQATTTTSTHVKSSQTSLVTATRKAYIGGSITVAQAQTALTSAGESPADQASLLALWDAQKTLEFAAQPVGPIIAPPTGG
jgi:hypothetical protein